ncbi:MAG: hypothetical protein Q7N50_15085 [Armatimonadota bacterium]|nr:hypothetical protein [Armatimonadota bacterium]
MNQIGRIVIPFFIAICLCCSSDTARTNGEPSGSLYNSGIIVPLTDKSVYVLDQRIDIILPKPGELTNLDGEVEKPVDIRVEYLLCAQNTKEPLAINVAWPTGGLVRDMRRGNVPEFPIDIKLDNKPVGFNFLRYNSLADPYVRVWLRRIDGMLDKKYPELQRRIQQARNKHQIKDWDKIDDYHLFKFQQTTSELGKWMIQQGIINKKPYIYDPKPLVSGLIGLPIKGAPRDRIAQSALKWLDPSYKIIQLDEVLADRWDYQPLLLHPIKKQLVFVNATVWGCPEFAIIRFPITLNPKEKHRLVVHYKDYLGSSEDWKGLTYIMKPARRWGRWEKTTITVKVPQAWKSIAIQPYATLKKYQNGYSIYRITIDGCPYENLYVSVVPPQSKK